jgi:RNA polymerase sigma-70 factor (ECF subfamily)
MYESATADVTEAETAPDLGRLYERHARAIARYVWRFARDADNAADLVHETFLRAVRTPGIPAEEGRALRWLYRVATNVAIDDVRRRKRLRFIGIDRMNLGEDTRSNDTVTLVRAALQNIPPEQAATLVLKLHEGFSRAEIAELLGTTEETVKTRLARGRLNFAASFRRMERGLSK